MKIAEKGMWTQRLAHLFPRESAACLERAGIDAKDNQRSMETPLQLRFSQTAPRKGSALLNPSHSLWKHQRQ